MGGLTVGQLKGKIFDSANDSLDMVFLGGLDQRVLGRSKEFGNLKKSKKVKILW